jgi:hypothetical protein
MTMALLTALLAACPPPSGGDVVYNKLVGSVSGQISGPGGSVASHARGPGPPHLTIEEEGEDRLLLWVLGDRLEGFVRHARVDVKVGSVELGGHLAGDPVWIWLHGHQAEGQIGGHPVSFVLYETPAGYLLRGQAVGHTVRLELADGTLSWLPSCEAPLVRLLRGRAPETVYQGTCASGQQMTVTVPAAFDRWLPLHRLILLALLLSDRADGSAAPRLFPPKTGPAFPP